MGQATKAGATKGPGFNRIRLCSNLCPKALLETVDTQLAVSRDLMGEGGVGGMVTKDSPVKEIPHLLVG